MRTPCPSSLFKVFMRSSEIEPRLKVYKPIVFPAFLHRMLLRSDESGCFGTVSLVDTIADRSCPHSDISMTILSVCSAKPEI